jgi:DNA-binding GntR family transcriptional regulator
MRENYEIRGILESHALRKAAATMTPERVGELKVLAQELNDISDGEEFLRKRMEFYHQLYDGDHHPQLVNLIEKLRSDAGRYWLQRKVDYVSRPGERDHLRILDFLADGNVDGAVAYLQEHLDKVRDRLVDLMEQGK